MSHGKTLLLVFIFFLFVSYANAVGIGVFEDEFDFAPNLNKVVQAFIQNNAGFDMDVKLYAEGDLAQYISFSENPVSISEGGRAWITFSISLPESIPPGISRIDICAEEMTSAPGGGITSKSVVRHGIKIKAPYPGRYLKAKMDVPEIITGEKATFNFFYENLGNESINSVSGTLDIHKKSVSWQKISSLQLPSVTDIKPKETKSQRVEADISGYVVGDYEAKAELSYENGKVELSGKFRKGDLSIRLINYTSSFIREGISKMEIRIQSFWSEPIDDVYAELIIGNMVLKTPETSIGAWEIKPLAVYIDTSLLQPGNYDANLKVYYSGKVFEQGIKLSITEKELPSQPKLTTTTILIAVVALLVLMNITLLVVFLRRKGAEIGGKKTETAKAPKAMASKRAIKK